MIERAAKLLAIRQRDFIQIVVRLNEWPFRLLDLQMAVWV
jgi:hypothetical protein